MRELIIALVKEAKTDVVRSCNDGAAHLVGRSLDEIVNRPSSEIWPDGGMRYRVDDAHVANSQTPKLNIDEHVVIGGKMVPVWTDKYPVGNGLIQVLVWRKATSAASVDYENRYSIAVVERGDWTPISESDVPPWFTAGKIRCFDTNALGEIQMSHSNAEFQRDEKNYAALRSGMQEWRVVVPPGFH